MKFTTTYLLQPKDSLSINPDKLAEIVLNEFATNTKCRAKLIDGKIVFSREKLFYTYRWLFTRMMDGRIQITRKEPYLAIQGTLVFPNVFLILWPVTLVSLSAFLIYIGFPIWFVISWAGMGLVFLVSFSSIVSLISFNSFIKNSIGAVGEVLDLKQMQALDKS
jgi:hypothetical protein